MLLFLLILWKKKRKILNKSNFPDDNILGCLRTAVQELTVSLESECEVASVGSMKTEWS